MKTGLAMGTFVLLVGCGADAVTPEPPLATIDLRAALGTTDDVNPIGLAIAPDGQRFVFEETGGLYRLDGDRAVVVVPMSAMPMPDEPIELPVTDLVALAPNLFALTAIGDGFLLDTSALTLRQHFCYLPGEGGGSPVSLTQRTDGITYDAAHGKLYAQPITYDAAGVFQYSQIAAYDRESGVDIEWHTVADDVAATAMIVIPDVGIVLGQRDRLSLFDPTTDQVTPLDDLERFGVKSIDGLAIDPVTGSLVIVDRQADIVFDVELSRLSI